MTPDDAARCMPDNGDFGTWNRTLHQLYPDATLDERRFAMGVAYRAYLDRSGHWGTQRARKALDETAEAALAAERTAAAQAQADAASPTRAGHSRGRRPRS